MVVPTARGIVFVASSGDVLAHRGGELHAAELKPAEGGGFEPRLFIPEPGVAEGVRRAVEAC